MSIRKKKTIIRENVKKSRIKSLLLILVLLLAFTAPISYAAEEKLLDTQEQNTEQAKSEPEFSSFSELSGKTIAMLVGAPFEEMIKSKVGDVKEFQYYATLPDMQLALESGKIDAFFMNSAIATLLDNKNNNLAVLPENLGEDDFGFAFKKGNEDRDKWQKAYDSLDKADIEEAWQKWTGSDETIKKLPDVDWEGNAGSVNVVACNTLEPMCYVGEGGEIVGFDIEILMMMAKKLDIKLNVKGSEFASIMPEVQSGKSDIGCGSIMVTDERRELVDFVDYYPGAYQLMVRTAGAAKQSEGFFEGIVSSFHRTFIREGRYSLVLTGLLYTVLMAAAAGILGLLIGFSLVFLRRKDIAFFNALIKCYTSIITGIPVIVILMVLYYIVFGAVDISAVIVATIGFAIIFGSRVYGTVINAVKAVDIGQQEAAYALGYTDGLAFRKIILPQARPIYTPLLQTQFVMLVKETSVAGYITVVDLTKAGDLIRSRTMEAFFPLIAIAVIYFLLTWALTKLIKAIGNKRIKLRREGSKREVKA